MNYSGTLIFLILISAFFTGMLALSIWTTKGGSAVAGFLLGFLLGPFGLFYVAFAFPGAPCPHCNVNVPKHASVCRFCSNELEDESEDGA